MVNIPDIKDEQSLKWWLEDQPREVSVWIASRAAARVMPVWWGEISTVYMTRDVDVTAIPILCSILISWVAAYVPTEDIRSAAASAEDVAGAAAPDANLTDAAFLAASSAVAASTSAAAAHNATNYPAAAYAADAADVAERASSAADAFWKAIRADAEEAAEGRLPDALPLWPDGLGPLAEQWRAVKSQVTNSDGAEDWQFWIEWYDAQLSGRTMLPDPKRTLHMLEQIALIDSAKWDAGPETVNPIISEIWELHRLRSEVAALQAEKDVFLATHASQAQRSHNQPPEGLVDDQPELARQITIVGDSLDDARDALEQDSPDKGRLHEIAERLLSALAAVARYCGKVADTAVMSAAKLGGGAGGAALFDYFVNNGRLMQFAKDLLSYASGG